MSYPSPLSHLIEVVESSDIDALAAAIDAVDPSEFVLSDAEVDRLRWALHLRRARVREGLTETPLPRAELQAQRTADASTRALFEHIVEANPSRSGWDVAPEVDFPGGVSPGDAAAQHEILAKGLRTGDVLVTRSPRMSSAGVAHLGADAGQFSHTLVVDVDPDGPVHVVAAYMEFGATDEDLRSFLAENRCTRIVVLRHRDGDLAARVGRAAHRRLVEGPPIAYDDVFNSDDPSELYCSEVPRWAFGKLVNEPVTLPLHHSPSDRPARKALQGAMGIDVPWLCSPVDYLVDPRLQIVAEWRDPSTIGLSRRQDAVIEAAMRWSDERGYVLSPGFVERATIRVGLAIRRTPVIGDLLKHTAGPDIRPQFLLGALTLQKAATLLLTELEGELGDRTPARGVLRDRLERIRERVPPNTSFHKWFHPKKP